MQLLKWPFPDRKNHLIVCTTAKMNAPNAMVPKCLNIAVLVAFGIGDLRDSLAHGSEISIDYVSHISRLLLKAHKPTLKINVIPFRAQNL